MVYLTSGNIVIHLNGTDGALSVESSVNCRFINWPVKNLPMRTKVAIDDVPEPNNAFVVACNKNMTINKQNFFLQKAILCVYVKFPS